MDSIYTRRLLGHIESKRQQSIREIGKSDIFTDHSMEDINAWYARIEELTNSNPPCDHVNRLTVIEDEGGHIIRIEYGYCPQGLKEAKTITINVIQRQS